MAKIIESLAVVNSTVRTLLGVVVVGGMGMGAWFGYDKYNNTQLAAQQTRAELTEARNALEELNVELDQSRAARVALEAETREQAEQITSLNETVRVKDLHIEQLDTALRLLRVNYRVAAHDRGVTDP